MQDASIAVNDSLDKLGRNERAALVQALMRARTLFSERYDVPFSQEDSYAALPWIIAFMVFLTVLCLTWAVDIQRAAALWQDTQERHMTVQVPLSDALQPEPLYAADDLLELLGNHPAVEHVHLVPEADVRALLAPWLGEDERLNLLPIPVLLDIVLTDSPEAEKEVQATLSKAFPEISVESHAGWLEDFQRLVRTLQLCALAVVLGILLMTGVILTMSTRTELTLHHKTLALLRSLGAERAYIARQFQANALAMAMRGVAVGGALALLVLWGISHAAAELEAPFLPLQHSGWLPWLILLGVAIIADVLVTWVARLTVLRRLKAMDG